MIEMICKNCRFWKEETKPILLEGVGPYGTCEEIIHRWPVSGDAPVKAWTEDCEEFASWLRTRPDFGCILFESQQAE